MRAHADAPWGVQELPHRLPWQDMQMAVYYKAFWAEIKRLCEYNDWLPSHEDLDKIGLHMEDTREYENLWIVEEPDSATVRKAQLMAGRILEMYRAGYRPRFEFPPLPLEPVCVLETLNF